MGAGLDSVLASDALMSSVLLFALAIISLKIFPINVSDVFCARSRIRDVIIGRNKNHTGSESYKIRAASAFYHYGSLANAEIDQLRKTYARLGRAHKRIGYELGYPNKLDRLAAVTYVNSLTARSIALASQESAGISRENLPPPVDTADIGKVREALKHFVRDWSTVGAQERNATFKPILEALIRTQPGFRRDMKVLVPGSGLGRLTWEINQLGFDVTAVELSPYMNFAFQFLLSPQYTRSVEQHTVHPYAYWFSHQRSNENLFRSVAFPDVLPRLSDTFHHFEEDFLALHPPQREYTAGGTGPPGYDVIVTLFFIDTSLNVIATLEKIRDLLRPGGTWINLGPLLWTGGSQAALELSLDEVLQLASKVGFDVDERSRKTLHCEYTADVNAMMQWIYKAEFWTAMRKA